jgi:glycosyltransferase involved in cell wall biosynthesis
MDRVPRLILYLHSTSEIGGSDISLLRIVEGLDRSRFEPSVVLPSDGPLVAPLRDRGCRVTIVPAMRKLTSRRGGSYLARYAANYPRAVSEIARLARREGAAIIHTNTIHNLYGFAAARVSRLPHVWHVREIVWQSATLRRLEQFLVTRFSDRVIVTSDAVAESIFNSPNGTRLAHVRKVPNGVDVDRFTPANDRTGVRRELAIDNDTPLVGIVCRLDVWKGVDTFLRAAQICRATRPDVRYVVVGGPIEGVESYADELRTLADTLGLADVVRFTGWRFRPEEMPQLHAALDVYVLASKQPEPFGLVLLEAMATGRPVVATNHGGPREICVHEETGLLVPPDDPRVMADAILRLVGDPARARAMGAAGRRRVETHYTQQRMVEGLQRVYEELLQV